MIKLFPRVGTFRKYFFQGLEKMAQTFPRVGKKIREFSNPWKTRGGFTLLELLVVVAVMGLLAALVSPAARRGLEKGREARCMSNIKALCMANLLYADDQGSYCPASDINGANNQRWHGMRSHSGVPFEPTEGPLAPYLGADRQIRMCPSARFAEDGFEAGCGGYGYNAVGVGSRSYLHGFNEASDRRGMDPGKISNPGQTLMFADAVFVQNNALIEYSFAEPYQFVSGSTPVTTYGKTQPTIHFRHGGRTVVGWCDGHVSSEKLTYTQKAGGFEKNDVGWLDLNNSRFDPY